LADKKVEKLIAINAKYTSVGVWAVFALITCRRKHPVWAEFNASFE
jgi:hypothetical protein